MILREIVDSSRSIGSACPAVHSRPIWDVLFEHQSKLNSAKEVWLITQPSHSALSGEIAAKLRPEIFGAFDESTIRAIALHDAGWGASDSGQIKASRDLKAKTNQAVFSFLGVAPRVAVAAW